MNLRMIGLGAVVACATLLPLVALAGPASGPGRDGDSKPRADGGAGGRADGGLLPGLGVGGSGAGAERGRQAGSDSGADSGTARGSDPGAAGPGADRGAAPGSASGAEAGAEAGVRDGSGGARDSAPPSALLGAPGASSPVPARSAHCGPELTSPDGIEAQTCVLTEGPDTWGRTYYRNAGGQRLDAVLTLMGPAGRTVQVRCAVVARDEPGVCETPRERARGAVSAYSAVAEFAGAGEGSSTPLLLRAGSNTAGAGGS
ncbi:hypothetical protein [Streptomyces sp. NPDC047981]|uniref:hypothetical protein n=1 Tax=Streptomyces sp. NPDC047981 TaxID=3154610 RepID=UPI0034184682